MKDVSKILDLAAHIIFLKEQLALSEEALRAEVEFATPPVAATPRVVTKFALRQTPREVNVERIRQALIAAYPGSLSYRQLAAMFPEYDPTTTIHWASKLIRRGQAIRVARSQYRAKV